MIENVIEKGIGRGLVLLFGLVLVLGFFVHEGLCQSAMALNEKVKMGQYVQKVDNFMVILDASDTMNTPYEGRSRWQIARELVLLLNGTIPDPPIVGAVREYSDTGNYNDLKPTELVYAPTRYSKSGFEQGVNKIKKAEGNSPLDLAINAATEDLATARGDIAVIIVSDGAHIPHGPVVKAAENLKGRFSDRLCVYTVQVGDDPMGMELLKKVAQTGKCGFYTTADSLGSEAAMAAFVEKVFLAKKPPAPKPIVAPKAVVPPPAPVVRDSDGDGVPDDMDKCPDTPKGATVDERGCWLYTGAFLFDFNKWNLKPGVGPALDNAVKILKENPDLKVEIQGHTDNIGPAAYNQQLSLKRAQSVYQYFVDHGIEKSRLSVKGYGFSRPAYSNATKEGRAKNRRVEFAPER